MHPITFILCGDNMELINFEKNYLFILSFTINCCGTNKDTLRGKRECFEVVHYTVKAANSRVSSVGFD